MVIRFSGFSRSRRSARTKEERGLDGTLFDGFGTPKNNNNNAIFGLRRTRPGDNSALELEIQKKIGAADNRRLTRRG